MPFSKRELAAVDRVCAGEHPQQRGLAGPVAAGERHAIAPLELERDALEQRRPRHVLVQRRCDHDRHGPSAHPSRRAQRSHDAPAPWACGPLLGAYRRGSGPQTPGSAVAASWPGASTGWSRRRSCASSGLTKDGGRRRVQARRLHRLHRGVYAVGHKALTPTARLIAAVLRLRARARSLSHRAAGGPLGARRASAPHRGHRAARPQAEARHHRPPLPRSTDEDRTVIDGIPVTSVARTLVDLADVLNERRLARAVHQAEILRVFDLTALERALARCAADAGAARLARVLAAYQPEPHIPAQRGRAPVQALCTDARPSPAAVQRRRWPATRSTSTGPKRGSPSRSTARETHHTATPSTRTAGGTGPSRRRASRCCRVTWPDLRRATLARSRSAGDPRAGASLEGVPDFKVNPAYTPVADQEQARDELAEGIDGGDRFQTLLGVTGAGKTATMAFTIEQVQRPALVIAHNKTLAAQLCNEFREFFPDNAVEYFVSYYDYYQPEAYVPSSDLYIEKDSSINQEIERLRHAATAALFGRRDTIVVASVSCIFGLGSPEKYDRLMLMLKRGRDGRPRRRPAQARRHPVHAQRHGARPRQLPRARRDARGLPGLRRDRLPRRLLRRRDRGVHEFDPLTGELLKELELRRGLAGDPLRHRHHDDRARGRSRSATSSSSAPRSWRSRASCSSRTACASAPSSTWRCCASSASATGSRTTRASSTAAPPGERPYCLIDFFPEDFVCFIDESHQTVPQIGGMYEGDRSRKQTLVDYGFRLPSALDNRPQTFDEFLAAHAADRVRLGHARATSSATTPAASSSRSCARPASSTPRSTCARRRTRSTT